MAGAEIYSALREHSMNGRGRVRVEITALAASAASVIAMAGDEIAMYPTSYMMIHNPWTMAIGDAKEMRKAARTLDAIQQGLINAYQNRTGKSRDELKRMLDNETWMSAGTCVEEGFADEVIGSGSAGRAVACAMSRSSHGIREILERLKAEERDPDEEADEEADEPKEAPEESPEEPEEPEGPEEPEKPEEPEEPEEEETEPDGETEKKEDRPRNGAIARILAQAEAAAAAARAWMDGMNAGGM